jgi:hypothetical protein
MRTVRSERVIASVVVTALLGTAVVFRSMGLSSVPGVSGDEGWWGVQALAWLSGQRYETRTTSGNPTDLFHLIPVAWMHTIVPPSFFALRAVPALVNLIALPIAFMFARRVYGATTAWIYTVALAILPTSIAHSRICQDPSQSVFWTGLVIYACLLGLQQGLPRHSAIGTQRATGGRGAWIYLGTALMIFPVALWTHPTNVFIAPFLLLPLAAAVPLLPTSRRGRTLLFAGAGGIVIAGLSVGWIVFQRLAASHEFLDQPWLAMASARLVDGGHWFEFAANNARLFNGITVYHYFSGARPATLPYDAAFVVVVIVLLAGFLLAPAAQRSRLDDALVAACVLTWIFFYAFAGPDALRPHFERWGLCLLVPGALVLARGLSMWIEWRPRFRWVAIGLATVVAASLLTSFYVNYFRQFATTGGRSHLTYITAPIEPKARALEFILLQRTGPGASFVVAQQWWLYYPLRYLATEHPHVTVTKDLDRSQPGFEAALREGGVFFVEFARTPQAADAHAWILARGLKAASTTIPDASGRGLIEILQVGVR